MRLRLSLFLKAHFYRLLQARNFLASLAAPAPEPEPEAQPDPCGCGNGCGNNCGGGRGGSCSVTKVQTVPVSSHIPIKTTHKILSDNGCGGGWGSWSGGCGGWSGDCGYGGLAGLDGWGSGWDSGYDGGWGDCVITRIHHIPVTTHIPVKTTHRVLPHSGSKGGWSGYGNGCGCGCGCNGWF